MRTRFIRLVIRIQLFLILAHAFLFVTLWYFAFAGHAVSLAWMIGILAFSFLITTLAAFRWRNWLVNWSYCASAFWMGLAWYLLLASLLCWPIEGVLQLVGRAHDPRYVGLPLFGAALAVALYGLIHAARTQATRVAVALDFLPAAWEGRRLAFVSDLHLGAVRGPGFARRIARRIARLQPDAILIGGDLFDGSAVDARRMTRAWDGIAPPLGIFFVTGNHEEFHDTASYVAALSAAGVRVLDDELVDLQGIQLIGTGFHSSQPPERFARLFARVGLDRNRPSILLRHVPDHLPIAEAAGVALQLSGHTHNGQTWPFNLMVRRIFGRFAYGLHATGRMQVYTSSGVGTWGPPFRVGTRPEIVLLELHASAGERAGNV